MNYSLLTLMTIVLTGMSCHLSKTTTSGAAPEVEPEWVPWEIKYERGPCFGECPVYVFYLLSDHHGLVESRYNLLEPGWYEADLDQEAVHQILMDIEPESWWNEDLSDLPEIADLPVMSILYKHKDGLRWFSVRGKISNQIADVQQKIEHLVREARWKVTTRRPLNPDVPEPTDVIVQLKDGVDIQDWMRKYERFGIRLKKRIAPHQPYYLVSKDPGMGDANDFLQYIKHDEEVIDAQWDQALSPRK
jgi:hypothetical protein